MYPHITEMIYILTKTYSLFKFRYNILHCTNLIDDFYTLTCIFGHKYFAEFCIDSFNSDDRKSVNVSLHCSESFFGDFKTVPTRKSDTTKDSQRIVDESLVNHLLRHHFHRYSQNTIVNILNTTPYQIFNLLFRNVIV